MEPDSLNIESVTLGFATLLLIPTIIFALLAEYLTQSFQQELLENPELDREPELNKIRVGGIIVLLFQLTLFLSISEVRLAYPFLSQLYFMGVVLLQMRFQSDAERKIKPVTEKKTDDFMGIAFRAALTWMAGVGIYIVILFLCIRGSALIGDLLHTSTPVSIGLMFGGGALGVLLGLGANFLLGPTHLRRTLPAKRLEDEELKSRLSVCFQKAKLTPPQFWIIELHELKIAHLIFSGLHGGPRSFPPALFISTYTLSILTESELEAVVLNQVSRLSLKHLSRRFFFALVLILATSFLSLFSIALGRLSLGDQMSFQILGPAVALSSFIISFRLISNQIRNQEMGADLHCIQVLGASPEHLISALRKLDTPSLDNRPDLPQELMPTSPETERRIAAIQVACKEFKKDRVA